MGDRTMWTAKCPKCGKDVEYYDAPSCLMYGTSCECGWRSPYDYYEIADNEIVLCTKEEYRKNYKYTDWCQKRQKEMAELERESKRGGTDEENS